MRNITCEKQHSFYIPSSKMSSEIALLRLQDDARPQCAVYMTRKQLKCIAKALYVTLRQVSVTGQLI
jgi:hypothetical protein